jgi:flotillin
LLTPSKLLSVIENMTLTIKLRYLGDVGEKEKQRDTRIQSADFESLAVQKENERAIEMAKSTAELKVEQAQADRKTSIAQIETEMAAEMRRSELQKDVETRNIAQQTEKMRSELLVKAVVESEAIERRAEADLVKKKKEGEGLLFYKQCEAEGLLATFNAQSEGLKKLLQAHPDPMVALQYMMIDRDVFTKLSDSNAKAIQGLQPKITHWVTGKDGSDPMGQIFKNLPPMIETIYNQTGVRPPNWLMNTDQLVLTT